MKVHKDLKGLETQNLRDPMSEAERIFTALAERSTRQIAETTALEEGRSPGDPLQFRFQGPPNFPGSRKSLVYEVDTFVKLRQVSGMGTKYPNAEENPGTSPVVRDFEATYRVGSMDLAPAVADIINRHDLLEAVRLISATVQEQLALAAKPRAKYASAIMRGLLAREELKQAEGGSYSAEETRLLLGISKAAVLKRYQKGQLIGWREASQNAVRFPAWQFLGDNVLPGLPEVLAIFAEADWVDDWTRIVFFLNSRHSLAGKRPLDILREGDTKRVCGYARSSLD